MFSLLIPAKEIFKQNRNWLILALSIFLIGALLSCPGLFFEEGSLPGAESQMGELQKLVELIMDSPPIISSMMIFLNNMITVIQMLFLGVIAGISPLATLFLNGYILGIAAASCRSAGFPLTAMIVLGILPRGIFELSAVFICAALGLKLGYHCTISPLPDKTRLQSFKYIWKEIVSIMPLVVLLLFCAALIEIFITPRLMGGLI